MYGHMHALITMCVLIAGAGGVCNVPPERSTARILPVLSPRIHDRVAWGGLGIGSLRRKPSGGSCGRSGEDGKFERCGLNRIRGKKDDDHDHVRTSSFWWCIWSSPSLVIAVSWRVPGHGDDQIGRSMCTTRNLRCGCVHGHRLSALYACSLMSCWVTI
jgi:hypothetical protein